MNGALKAVFSVLGILVVAAGVYFFIGSKKAVSPIDLNNDRQANGGVVDTKPMNPENVSALAGLACENRNRRPIAVMQPADVTARPAAGFSDADLIIEMPVITATINRLMAVYQCTLPTEAGAVRSSRTDFLHVAKGLDAIYVHWGGSHFALDHIREGILDNIDCTGAAGNGAGTDVCYRAEQKVGMKMEDTSRVNVVKALERATELGYRTENKFSGYPHREEAALDARPTGGRLRIGYPGAGEVEYLYDKESNTWKRVWGNVLDTDRNNGKRIAPKNVAVIFSKSEQIEGQYNNMQLGDPWGDTSDSGDAFYYIDGRQTRGTWKKDKANIGSKFMMYDEAGQEVKFVPGQIWLNVVEPGTAYEWQPGA